MEYIENIRKDVFLQRYAIYFGGSMVVAFLNYLFHPILGRLLSPASFGDIQALISILTQAGVLLGAFSIVAVNITTNVENHKERDAVISELQKIAFYIVVVASILVLVFSQTLQEFLNFTSVSPFFGLALILPLIVAVTFRNAYLQGSGRFVELSLGGIVSSSGRLLLSAGLILLGWGLFGAVAGLVLAQVALLIYLVFKTRDTLHLTFSSSIHVLEKGRVKEEIIYGFLVLFSTLLVAVMYTSDVLIVKRYFDAHDAGIYSGISAIAKIIFFVVAPVATVMLSSIKLKQSFKENRKTLLKSLLIAIGVGVASLSTFYLFYDMVVRVLIGENYLSLGYLLPKAGLVMLLSAILNVLVFYFLALRRYVLVWVSCIGIITMFLLVGLYHETISDILNAIIISITGIIIILVSIYAKDYFNHRSSLQ